MPKFSAKSINKLHTSHQDLQILFRYVIKKFDCTVVYGHRTPEEQFELYKKGREYVEQSGKWVVFFPKKVVTNCDGFQIKSNHNEFPSHAVDVAPYPTLYNDEDTIRHFAGYVLGVADMLKSYGAIEHEIISGIDWDNDKDLHDQKLFDACHFELNIK